MSHFIILHTRLHSLETSALGRCVRSADYGVARASDAWWDLSVETSPNIPMEIRAELDLSAKPDDAHAESPEYSPTVQSGRIRWGLSRLFQLFYIGWFMWGSGVFLIEFALFGVCQVEFFYIILWILSVFSCSIWFYKFCECEVSR